MVDGLREHLRAAGWLEDFDGAVRRAFAEPDVPAAEGWEPLRTCRERVVATVRPVLAAHADEDVVLVGHGTAWTVLAAELTGGRPTWTGGRRSGCRTSSSPTCEGRPPTIPS